MYSFKLKIIKAKPKHNIFKLFSNKCCIIYIMSNYNLNYSPYLSQLPFKPNNKKAASNRSSFMNLTEQLLHIIQFLVYHLHFLIHLKPGINFF